MICTEKLAAVKHQNWNNLPNQYTNKKHSCRWGEPASDFQSIKESDFPETTVP